MLLLELLGVALALAPTVDRPPACQSLPGHHSYVPCHRYRSSTSSDNRWFGRRSALLYKLVCTRKTVSCRQLSLQGEPRSRLSEARLGKSLENVPIETRLAGAQNIRLPLRG